MSDARDELATTVDDYVQRVFTAFTDSANEVSLVLQSSAAAMRVSTARLGATVNTMDRVVDAATRCYLDGYLVYCCRACDVEWLGNDPCWSCGGKGHQGRGFARIDT